VQKPELVGKAANSGDPKDLEPGSCVVYHKACMISVERILNGLPKLAPEKRREMFEQLAELETQYTYCPTHKESAATDEAICSLEAGKGIPAAEMRRRFAAKWSR
jgi:hypothetical protein